MGKLDGKVAIVTGAARGLGRAYALHLAGLGAKVALSDVDLESYREFDAEAAAMTGIGHSPFRPNSACHKSACSVLVGNPVLGPPR